LSIKHSDLQNLPALGHEIRLFEKCQISATKITDENAETKIPVVEFEAYKEREVGFQDENETLQIEKKSQPLISLFDPLRDFNLKLLSFSNDTRSATMYEGFLEPSLFAVGRWSTLTSMYLSGFKIRQIEANAFKTLVNLRSLGLSILELECVDPLAFAGLSLLEELDLTGNELEMVELGTFDELLCLKKLYLTSNRIGSVGPRLFEKLAQLVELSLSYNPIETFDDESFTGLGKLEYLCLSGVPIDAWFAERSQFLSKHLKNIKRIKLNHQ
jgi:Leucine-rich repeat (LRR) protein